MAISRKRRRKAIRMYNRYEKNLLKKYVPKLEKFFNRQSKRIAAAIKKKYDTKQNNYYTDAEAEKIATKVFDLAYNIENDLELLQTTIFGLLLNAGEIGNDLANIRLYASANDYQLFSIIEPKYIKFLTKYGLNEAKNINKTTKKKIINTIKKGIIKGDTYADIANNIVKHTKSVGKSRAVKIVSTEVHTSFMTVRNVNATIAGFKEKAWMDSRDSAVRDTHRRYDSQGWVALDHLWGGMMYPGDPNGTPENVINCRCEIEYR